jgi:predicted porin
VNLGSSDTALWLGYRFDWEDPTPDTAEAQQFGYTGNEVSVGSDWAFPFGTLLRGSYAYRHERYAAESGGRIDKTHDFLVTVRHPVAEHLDLVGSYAATLNGSNDPTFDYTRQNVAAGLEVRF